MGLELKFGNRKLGDDIGIFNMGTAKECPAKILDLCDTVNRGIKCYAEKAEDQYPKTVPAARKRQELYWRNTSAINIIKDIIKKLDRRRKITKYIRFNESGDFWNQNDVDKLSTISEFLKLKGITVYGYTARSDLDFSKAMFLVKGSGHDKGNNGKTIVITKNELVPEGYIECPGSCRKCSLCQTRIPHKIAFRKH